MAFVASCILLVGCHKQEPIVTYKVPKHESIQIPVETPNQSDGSTESAEPPAKTEGRMLAALILDGDVSWSFKALAAPGDFPEDAAQSFDDLIKSLKFESPEKPTWELGDKWTELPGGGMRAANLMLGQVRFSVIKLPMRSPNKQEYVLSNVNRWRGQLSLPDIGLGDLDSSVRTIPTSDAHDATVLDLTGMQSGTAMGPMAGARRQPAPSRSAPKNAATPKEPQFTSKAPAEWQAMRPGMMQLATYAIANGDKTAKVSVSKAGGDVFQNINRWRGQVGLADLKSADDLETEDVTVSDQAGLLAEIYGDDGQSIVITMVPADKPTWFFKMKGETELVKENVPRFREYLKTIQLK